HFVAWHANTFIVPLRLQRSIKGISEHKNRLAAALITTGAAPAIIDLILFVLALAVWPFRELVFDFVCVVVVQIAALISRSAFFRSSAAFLNGRHDPRRTKRPPGDLLCP